MTSFHGGMETLSLFIQYNGIEFNFWDVSNDLNNYHSMYLG